jgi:hypothetical protein
VVRDFGVSGFFLSCGVGSRGLDLKFTMDGSLLVIRREAREGVLGVLLLSLLLLPLAGAAVDAAASDD